ncbi:MAG: glycosyltransferase [Candidatus Aminicenantes bacterium]|nr:glycosyltransferase [Candidatus Aminicenantes bacterium]
MNLKNPTFSIVVPTYNRENMVIRATNSLLKQTYENFEVIVVDDCSTDNTEEKIKEIMKRYNRIKYIKTEKNLGGAGARNLGAEKARADFLGFLDSDDEALPNWLKLSFYIIKKLPETWGGLYPRHLEKNDLTDISYHNTTPLKSGYIYESLLKGNAMHIGTSGIIVRKKIFKLVGGFDESLRGFNDIDLFYRIAKNYTFHYINSPQIIVHHHNKLRLTAWNKQREKAYDMFLDKWRKENSRISPFDSTKKNKNGLFFYNFYQLIIEKNRLMALGTLMKCLFKNRLKVQYLFKCIVLIIAGNYLYDLFKKIRGLIYWGFFSLDD